MQIATVSNPVIDVNRQVAGSLATAHALTEFAQTRVEAGHRDTHVLTALSEALDSATQAREGVQALGKQNLLDGTFQRYSNHAVRQLTEAVRLVQAPDAKGIDRLGMLQKVVFDAEVSTRLGSQAAERSLKNPSPKALVRAQEAADSGSGPAGSGMTWVDGAWLDGLGNPVRGGSGWAGPDGERYGWDGSPDRGTGGGFTGPDGEDYSDII